MKEFCLSVLTGAFWVAVIIGGIIALFFAVGLICKGLIALVGIHNLKLIGFSILLIFVFAFIGAVIRGNK